MKRSIMLVVGCVLTLQSASAMVVTGRVMLVHGGDTLRVMTPGVAVDFDEAVLASSRVTNLLGRRVVIDSYVNEASTRHLVAITYSDTGETKWYTFKTVVMDGAPTAGPDHPLGYAAQMYLREKIEGHTSIVKPAEPAAAGTLRGVVRIADGKKIVNITSRYHQTATYRHAKDAAPPSPATGYSYHVVPDSELVKDKPRVKLSDVLAPRN